MTEQQALSTCNNWVNLPRERLLGYFKFKEANFLVGTDKYEFWQTGWMGYVLRKKEDTK